jgi:hypothetical protein
MADIEAHELPDRNGHVGISERPKSTALSGQKYDLARPKVRGGHILCG